MRTTSAKYPYEHLTNQIRNKIEKGVFQPGMRIPSQRDLAKTYELSLVTAHKAVSALITEGLLFQKRGRGVYVSDNNRLSERGGLNDIGNHPLKRELVLGFGEIPPHMKDYWSLVSDTFEEKHRFLSARTMDSRKVFRKTEIPDIEEAGLDNDLNISAPSFLDLSSATKSLTGSQEKIQVLGDYYAPLKLSSQCLFYNKKLLKKSKIPEPDFGNFIEQKTFFERVAEYCIGAAPKPAVHCTHQPFTWLGEQLDLLLSAVNRNKLSADERSLLINGFNNIVSLRRIFEEIQELETHSSSLFDEFVNGEVMLLAGWSYMIPQIKFSKTRVDWGVVPFFSVDDHIYTSCHVLGIRSETPYPIECIRLLAHIQGEVCQEKLAELGELPFNQDVWAKKTSNQGSSSSHSLLGNLEKIRIISTHLFQQYGYLIYNIINDEIWREVRSDRTSGNMLDNILNLCKIYMDLSLEKNE